VQRPAPRPRIGQLLLPLIVFAVSCVLLDAAEAAAPPATAKSNTASIRSISDEIAFLLIGLIADSMQRPTVNVVDTYAAAFHWLRNPPEMNALMNAKVGYHGKINGQTVVLGGDGTNDIIAVAITQGFEPAHVVAAIRQAFTLTAGDTEESGGQRSDSYYVLDHGKSVGIMFLTYGVAEAIRGTGSIGFMSIKKAREGAGK
jgi:hypothetical protein